MHRAHQEAGRYRVFLIRVGENEEGEKDFFCKNLSENYGIPVPLLRKIVDRCPIVIKKNLSLKKAETLAKILRSFGATVSIEEKEDFAAILLEFQEMAPHRVALESSHLRRTQSGAWNVIGRTRNISEESLNDTWVLIQLFDDLGEFLTFEETPLPINPLPPGEASPFRLFFDGDLSIQRVSIAFKNSSGSPLAAADRRRERGWVEVREENEGTPQSFDIDQSFGAISLEEYSDVQSQEHPLFKTDGSSIAVEGNREIEGEGEEPHLEEAYLLGLEEASLEGVSETEGRSEEIMLRGAEEIRGDEVEIALNHESSQTPTAPILHVLEKEKVEGETVLSESEYEPTGHLNGVQEAPSSRPGSEVALQLKEEIYGGTEEKDKQGPPLFPWMEDFRKSVENYYEKNRNIFSVWFEMQQKEGEFTSSLHSVLTILVHARFDQMCQSEKALENTQRVFRKILQPNLPLEETPALEGTKFFSGENWGDLFCRALPKLQQVASKILEKEKWDASDLMRFIQVIPHMGDKNSRMATRWIGELIPHLVEMDFSSPPISIGESLYRVASRLGIVDPHYDHYQGRNSAGDLKIQTFAKEAFPQFPMKIEEPVTWVGMKEEEGGHCFPAQPRCEGCLFEAFCPKLYFHFNPSEKGMRGR
jgi:hypothetical protein